MQDNTFPASSLQANHPEALTAAREVLQDGIRVIAANSPHLQSIAAGHLVALADPGMSGAALTAARTFYQLNA